MNQKLYNDNIIFSQQSNIQWENKKKYILGLIPRAVFEYENVENEVNKVYGEFDALKNQISGKTREIEKIQQQIMQEQKTASENLEGIKNEVKTLEKEVNENRRLVDIRKEQVAALQKKHLGNLHSSWMGLFRPMKSESRLGIAIISITMLILSILMIGFLYKHYNVSVLGNLMNFKDKLLNQLPNPGF